MTTETETFLIAVEGMTCNSCVVRVRSALEGVAGVEEVEVALPGTARVSAAAGTGKDQLIAAVTAAGYRAASGAPAGLPVITPGGSCCS